MENKPEPPDGWKLTYAEVSNGVYHMQLIWKRGPVVETTGDDVETMRAWGIKAALDMEEQVRRKGMLA